VTTYRVWSGSRADGVVASSSFLSSRTHVHVHVKLPSRQDARPPVPWRHTVEGADQSNTKFGFSPHKSITPPLSPTPLFSRSLPEPFSRPQFSSPPPRRLSPRRRRSSVVSCPARAGLQGTARPDATGGRTAGTGSSCSSSNTPASSGHQWSSVVISGHRWSSVVIGGYQRSSVVISGPQWSSVVISGT